MHAVHNECNNVFNRINTAAGIYERLSVNLLYLILPKPIYSPLVSWHPTVAKVLQTLIPVVVINTHKPMRCGHC